MFWISEFSLYYELYIGLRLLIDKYDVINIIEVFVSFKIFGV